MSEGLAPKTCRNFLVGITVPHRFDLTNQYYKYLQRLSVVIIIIVELFVKLFTDKLGLPKVP